MTAFDLPDPIRRRLGLSTLSPNSDALRRAAHEREGEFSRAVLRASTGADCDVDEVLDLGARCGLTPYRVFIALRSAESAHALWQASVHQVVFPHHTS